MFARHPAGDSLQPPRLVAQVEGKAAEAADSELGMERS